MVMPATDDRVTTIEELLALPEDGMRHELLDGVHVVTPAPRYMHQRVLSELFEQLLACGEGSHRLELLWSPAAIRLGPTTLVQPDLFVVAVTKDKIIEDWSDFGIPFVAIEVLSPSTASRDRGVKRMIYQKAGVAEYWIVDLDAKLIERWTPDDERPEICIEVLRCTVAGIPVEIDVRKLF